MEWTVPQVKPSVSSAHRGGLTATSTKQRTSRRKCLIKYTRKVVIRCAAEKSLSESRNWSSMSSASSPTAKWIFRSAPRDTAVALEMFTTNQFAWIGTAQLVKLQQNATQVRTLVPQKVPRIPDEFDWGRRRLARYIVWSHHFDNRSIPQVVQSETKSTKSSQPPAEERTFVHVENQFEHIFLPTFCPDVADALNTELNGSSIRRDERVFCKSSFGFAPTKVQLRIYLSWNFRGTWGPTKHSNSTTNQWKFSLGFCSTEVPTSHHLRVCSSHLVISVQHTRSFPNARKNQNGSSKLQDVGEHIQGQKLPKQLSTLFCWENVQCRPGHSENWKSTQWTFSPRTHVPRPKCLQIKTGCEYRSCKFYRCTPRGLQVSVSFTGGGVNSTRFTLGTLTLRPPENCCVPIGLKN